MATALAELKQKAAQLEESERAELALALIESLDDGADAGADEAWRIEFERRAMKYLLGFAVSLGDSVLVSSRG